MASLNCICVVQCFGYLCRVLSIDGFPTECMYLLAEFMYGMVSCI